MRLSAGKISEKPPRSTIAKRRTQSMATAFPAPWKIPASSELTDIQNTYLPMGFSNFKIEGRGLGSALILEFLLYYLTKPDCQLRVREEIYLDNALDLF